MAFSKTSFFAGVGSVFAAIAIGFAAGAMITGSVVQSPNRVERVAAGESLQKSTGQPAAVANAAPQTTEMAAVPVPASDPQPVVAQQPPAAPASARTADAPAPTIQRPLLAPAIVARDDDAPPSNAPQSSPAPATTARGGDAAPPSNEQASDRAAELRKAAERKRADERKFAERKRQEIERAANAIRQMKRDGVIDQVVERDEAPRVETPRFGFLGNNDN